MIRLRFRSAGLSLLSNFALAFILDPDALVPLPAFLHDRRASAGYAYPPRSLLRLCPGPTAARTRR